MKFLWKYCDVCKCMTVICPMCGNNCCNGGYGENIMGDECDICELAYQFQELAEKTGKVPKIPKNEKITI